MRDLAGGKYPGGTRNPGRSELKSTKEKKRLGKESPCGYRKGGSRGKMEAPSVVYKK